jgi:hypothetical protein
MKISRWEGEVRCLEWQVQYQPDTLNMSLFTYIVRRFTSHDETSRYEKESRVIFIRKKLFIIKTSTLTRKKQLRLWLEKIFTLREKILQLEKIILRCHNCHCHACIIHIHVWVSVGTDALLSLCSWNRVVVHSHWLVLYSIVCVTIERKRDDCEDESKSAVVFNTN